MKNDPKEGSDSPSLPRAFFFLNFSLLLDLAKLIPSCHGSIPPLSLTRPSTPPAGVKVKLECWVCGSDQSLDLAYWMCPARADPNGQRIEWRMWARASK